ncbi:MAG: OmpA family protein [Blastocatellia bacterium]|nr:OmpA family protein [Blastocatellia bacterium]
MIRSVNFLLRASLSLSLMLTAAVVLAQNDQSDKDNYTTRTTLAVRYPENRHTDVNITGTSLAPRVTGKAEVEYKRNDARIKLKVENLENPQTFGTSYTTYVVWTVTPEGQTDNLIELPSGSNVSVDAKSAAQTFGFIITVEPHSAVKVPSQKVIAETTLRKNAATSPQTTQAEYRVDKGNLYELTGAEAAIMKPDFTTPRLVLGARRSIDIARRAGAKEYAAEEFLQAQSMLQTLEQTLLRNLKDENKYSGLARDVQRLGQVARDKAVESEYQARIENEKQARIRSLEEARAKAEAAQAEAERVKAEAERAKAEAEKAKVEAELAERKAAEERARREQSTREAEAAKIKAEADRLAAQQALKQADDAKRERDAALQRLYVSLSEILDTKRETRGFIVNIGDVLFDTGRATLKPAAREKLSKLAGILLAYPGMLTMEIEGHTDSVGSDDLNNKLSLNRAESVRDYLVQSGVKQERVKSVQGFGKSKPIASNDTAAGRQANRRVEVVIDDSAQDIGKQ